jgi:hypothetical protein
LICGDEVAGTLTLTPAEDGCYLDGLAGRKLISPDGVITEAGVVVGRARREGPARVMIRHADGSWWVYCAPMMGLLECDDVP